MEIVYPPRIQDSVVFLKISNIVVLIIIIIMQNCSEWTTVCTYCGNWRKYVESILCCSHFVLWHMLQNNLKCEICGVGFKILLQLTNMWVGSGSCFHIIYPFDSCPVRGRSVPESQTSLCLIHKQCNLLWHSILSSPILTPLHHFLNVQHLPTHPLLHWFCVTALKWDCRLRYWSRHRNREWEWNIFRIHCHLFLSAHLWISLVLLCASSPSLSLWRWTWLSHSVDLIILYIKYTVWADEAITNPVSMHVRFKFN